MPPNSPISSSKKTLEVLDCLHTFPRGAVRTFEAEAGGEGGGFPCGVCHHRCTTKASELIEDPAVEKKEGKGGGGGGGTKRSLCECEEDSIAVHCSNCNQNYCDDCDRTWHGKGGRKKHIRIPIKEHMAAAENDGGGGAAAEVVMCPIHPSYPLTFFCKQDGCDTTICALCAAKGHSSHNYVDLSEASGATRQEIAAAVVVAGKALAAASNGITAVNKRRKVVEKAKQDAHAKAQQFFKKLQASIIARMKVVQADALVEGGRKDDVLGNQKDELEIAKERLENGMALATRVQKGASEAKLLQIKRLLINGLTAAAAHGVDLKPLCGPTVLFVADEALLALVGKIPTMGAISGSDTNPAACTAEGGGLIEAMVGVEVGFVVTAVDFGGMKRDSGGDGIALTVVFVGGGGGGAAAAGGGGGCVGGGAAGNTVTSVVDQKDGTYTCKYVIPEGSPEGENQLAVRILGQHIQGSPFAVHVSAGKRFAHMGAFDGNGVLHWIGTGCGTTEYANPHGKPGGVVAKMSTVCNGSTPSRFVEHAPLNEINYTQDTANSWMSVDLGAGRHLAPDYYCLRHGMGVGGYRLIHWRLEGSNDDSTWTLLKTHANDRALPAHQYSTASWPIEATADGASYRHFRIFQTGKDSEDVDGICCAGIELYGLLR
eukprot:gene32573-biopygen8576